MRTIVRAFMLGLSLLSFHEAVYSQQTQVAKSIPNSTSPDGVIGFLEFRPSDYGSQKHPLIIFLHGIGERGNGTSSQVYVIANNALPNTLATGRASMRFTANGQTSSFVVLSPQLSTAYGYWPSFYVKEMIKYAKANLSIDPNRIYVTGLSLGGGGVWRLLTDTEDYSFDGTLAAAAPICGTQEENDAAYCSTVGANHLPVWAFHSMDDTQVSVGATQHAETLSKNCGVTPAALLTYYQSGNHGGAWINAYDTGHITRAVVVNGVTSNYTASPNLYEWFLMNSRSGIQAPAPPVNTAPVSSAGTAQTITLPTNTVNLSGSGTGTNGATVSSYSWSQTAGPSTAAVSAPKAAATSVTGLVQGNYVFVLTVTDNHGLTSSAGVAITVNAGASNTAPIANAGAAQTITLPTSSVNLSGSGTGTNGATISAYSWSETAGPSTASVSAPTSAATAINGLVQGNYVFVLTVTDNHGLTNSTGVAVTVNAGAANTAPVANAGAAQTITLPTSSVNLSGSGTGTNGASISSYSWSQTAGPSTASVSAPKAAATAVSGLVQGSYVFVLTVTDNHGLTNSTGVIVTVNAGSAITPPVAYAGNVQTITLPASSVNLSGSGTGTNGASISGYSWSQTAGPSTANISSPNSAATAVTGLVQGGYVFVLTVMDNHGLANSTGVIITVNAGTASATPVANAGSRQTITLPASTVNLSGSGTGSNGSSISSYSWSQTDGPAKATVVSPNSASTSVTGLVLGSYVFVLTITDSRGLTNSTGVIITVNAGGAPVANAGSRQTIILPNSTVNLSGSGAGSNGSAIKSYSWSQTAGPSTANVVSPNSASTQATGLVQGSYVFVLTITDIWGLTNSTGVIITVNAAASAVASSQPIGYIRISTGPSQACADASADGRTAVYGTDINNGSFLYTDAALTQIYNGGWNWFSFTPVLGGGVTQSFAIYPNGAIMLLTQCGGTGARIASSSLSDEQAITELKAIKDAALSATALKETKLTLYPNPVHTSATIEMYSADNSVKTINVYYSNGVLKAKYNWQTIKGNNVFQLKNIAGLANGLYIIDIRDNNGKSNGKMKFIKM